MKDLEEWTNRIHLNKNVASIFFTIANFPISRRNFGSVALRASNPWGLLIQVQIYRKNQKLLLIYMAWLSFFFYLVKHNFNLRPFGEESCETAGRAGAVWVTDRAQGFPLDVKRIKAVVRLIIVGSIY